MKLFFSPCVCRPIAQPFFGKNRLVFEGVKETSAKRGIRFHNAITAFFLRLFFKKKIVDVKDIDGKIYHLNRGSLSDWLIVHNDELRGQAHPGIKTGMLNVTENAMRGWLDDVLKKKSPDRIVQIAKIKQDLAWKIEEKERSDANNWDTLASRKLPGEIEALQKQLADLQKARQSKKRVGFREQRVRVFDGNMSPDEVGELHSEVHPI
jgi:hypothetical protein